jgi:hypothetical protein
MESSERGRVVDRVVVEAQENVLQGIEVEVTLIDEPTIPGVSRMVAPITRGGSPRSALLATAAFGPPIRPFLAISD